jgi:hypothetical protein
MSENLDGEIDELARDIEQLIQSNSETLDELPEFDPKYRRMQEADVTEMFT